MYPCPALLNDPPPCRSIDPSVADSGLFRRSLGYSVSVDDGVYPADLERDVPLRDGGTIHVRPIKADDVTRLQAFHGRLSRDSIFFRFFSPLPVLTDERAAYFTTVDYDHRLAIVAVENNAVERSGKGE